MTLPQQLMLAYFAAAFFVAAWRHGTTPDTDPYNFWEDLLGLSLLAAILTAGEFWA